MSKETATDPSKQPSDPDTPAPAYVESQSTGDMKDLADARVEQLLEAGLLTEREAQAYVLRDVCSMCRLYTADRLGISPSGVDNALRSARQRLENARETLGITDDWGPQPEYPQELDDVDSEQRDGFNYESIETILSVVTRMVDPAVIAESPDRDDYDSHEAFERADIEYVAAIDAAVWRAIEDKSQQELYEEIRRSDQDDAAEAAELLDPRWLPMSKKAFVATREYFATYAEPEAHLNY